jgi:hypothetical protein
MHWKVLCLLLLEIQGFFFKVRRMLSVVVYACNPSNWEVEARACQGQGQPELHSNKTL